MESRLGGNASFKGFQFDVPKGPRGHHGVMPSPKDLSNRRTGNGRSNFLKELAALTSIYFETIPVSLGPEAWGSTVTDIAVTLCIGDHPTMLPQTSLQISHQHPSSYSHLTHFHYLTESTVLLSL